jgi:hypothetical protein
VDNHPGDDQAAAELRDLDRLIELAGPQALDLNRITTRC